MYVPHLTAQVSISQFVNVCMYHYFFYKKKKG